MEMDMILERRPDNVEKELAICPTLNYSSNIELTITSIIIRKSS
jgi:hypothetical protein